MQKLTLITKKKDTCLARGKFNSIWYRMFNVLFFYNFILLEASNAQYDLRKMDDFLMHCHIFTYSSHHYFENSNCVEYTLADINKVYVKKFSL